VATVEFRLRLDTASAPADTDGDGIYDSTEAEMGTRADLSDTDGDGLSDAQEDANRNGILDPGETSPLRADTDGDGVPDGQEDANRDGAWGYARPTRAGRTTARAARRRRAERGHRPAGLRLVFRLHVVPPFADRRRSVVQWKSVSGKTYGVCGRQSRCGLHARGGHQRGRHRRRRTS
jgi:hypothetical protein